MKKIRISITALLLLFLTPAFAQFTLTDNFRGSNIDNNVILGGSPTPALLTSGVNDPVNDGWLRVTNSNTNQKGFAYIKSSFPPTLGILLDFEYKSWRSVADSHNGADGFSVFLFDADSAFATGGYGGSLGYAPNSVAGVPKGMAGGYVGVGIDEYGNYSNPTEGRNGGPGQMPNTIGLRGPTTNNAATTNAWLAGYQVNPSPTADAIDYNTATFTRPTDAQFYRRVQVEILPSGSAYQVTVRWKTSLAGAFVQLLTYSLATPPPAHLRVGFAATTGSGVNYHEVRNLIITTPGNVRVDKSVDKGSAATGQQVTYTMNVFNYSPIAMNGLPMGDTLRDGGGVTLPLSAAAFTIDSIVFNNNGNTGVTAAGYTSGVTKTTGFTNPFSTTLNMPGNSSAVFTVTGTIKSMPAGGVIKNAIGINPKPTGVTDLDSTNNNFTVSTSVLSPNVDLVLAKTLDSSCANSTGGNTYSIVVSNNGTNATAAGVLVTVKDTLPTGFIVTNVSGTGWVATNIGNSYTFTRNNSLASGFSYPLILIKATPSATGTSWINRATVSYAGTESNTTNNSGAITLYSKPVAPVVSSPVAYCIGQTATALTAIGTGVLWYNTPTGMGSGTAPVPMTSTAGNTSWYASQSNGTCVSSLSELVITIRPNATLTLTSSPATTLQTVAVNNPITPINYGIGGSGVSATISNLPTGLATIRNPGTITIQGSPATPGAFNYTVTTTGGCSSATLSGSITVNIPLPVKLGSFTARADYGNARIDWTTYIEMNNAGFGIDRSTDGIHWEQIWFVQSVAPDGSSSTPLSYAFNDNSPLPGVDYYRLRQVDLDGKTDYSRVVSVEFSNDPSISVSPSPASTSITIRGISAGQVLRLIDLNGSIIQEKTANGNREVLDISHLASGTYLLQIFSKQKLIGSRQVLKLRL